MKSTNKQAPPIIKELKSEHTLESPDNLDNIWKNLKSKLNIELWMNQVQLVSFWNKNLQRVRISIKKSQR